MPVKMTPIEAVAGDAILVGDPRRAFTLAQTLTVQPKMSHQARGLWGYVGVTDDGRPLTVQATGSGGPSAVPVIGDLYDQGLRRAMRLGTCQAIDPGLEAGTLILVERAVAADGAGLSLNDGEELVLPDPELLGAFNGLGSGATISSHDLVERHEPEGQGHPEDSAAVARDLQTAATLAICRRLGVPAAAVLIVVEDRAGRRLTEENLWELFRSAGQTMLSRLGQIDPIDPVNPDEKPLI